jgi:HlyD family secretion protein
MKPTQVGSEVEEVTMKKTIGAVIAIALLCVGFVYVKGTASSGESQYRLVAVEQGDLEYAISATGTLDAVTTVEVGTQVSGIVSEIYVDFNDEVHEGQVVAILDSTLLAIAVRDAEANLERTQAQLDYAESELERTRVLFEKEMVTEVEFNQLQYEFDVAKATVSSAEIALERAERNLNYATITAPMSGTVIERNVEVGQTVAASLSAPQLFLIANDLALMQILASVDESDIGLIEEGQTVRFTVQAYQDETFSGTVRQVRLQSSSQENVVSYTVVIDVNNSDHKLLPGMTATVDFLVETATDVAKVANAALRFNPTDEMLAELREQRMPERGGQPDSLATSAGRARREASPPDNAAMLWYLDADGQLAMAPVRTGISDGQYTEIEGRDIVAGMMVIAGVSQSSQSSTSNPFQSQQSSRAPGPPGPGF